ncbi:MAG: hypothetical protein JNK53_05390 [Phycisphaerae bacterium]|nr:hypothetical protein [Phycisphaerae bacterium]
MSAGEPTRWVCAQCGYDVDRIEAGRACPECGSNERLPANAGPLIDRGVVRRVLVVQSIGAALCFVAALSSINNITPLAGALAGAGIALCLLVSPIDAMVSLYMGSRLARRPRALRHPGTVLLFVVLSGAAALVTGFAFGATGCVAAVLMKL